MEYGNLYHGDSDEEDNPSAGVQGLPADQVQYEKAMGQQQEDFVDPEPFFKPQFDQYQAPLLPPVNPLRLTEDDILDANFPVRIGETRFPTLRAAVAGAPALEPPNPGMFAQVHGRNAATWDRSMINQYPYYDDGPQVDGEERRDWENRVINARNQMGIILRPVPQNPVARPENTITRPRTGTYRPPTGVLNNMRQNVFNRARRIGTRSDNPIEEEDSSTDEEDNPIDEESASNRMHRRRLDSTTGDFDAQYAALWNEQQARIRQHNAARRAEALRDRRQYDIDNERPAGPDPQAPADGGDDLFDFSWNGQTPRRDQISANRQGQQSQQDQQGSMQSTPPGGNPANLGKTRCAMCKKHKKGCDLGQTGVPCTRCREKNYDCVPEDTPNASTRRPARTSTRARGSRTMGNAEQITSNRGRAPRRAGAAAANAAPLEERMDAIADILGPAPEIQGTSLFARRDEGIPRRRSASPLHGVLNGDKCGRCEHFGRPCEDERPCIDCLQRNLTCTGSYLNNPYRLPRSDDGSDKSGYGIFGQAFKDMGYGGANGGNGSNDATNNSTGSGQGGFGFMGSTQQYETSLQSNIDFASIEAVSSQQNLESPFGTAMEGYNGYAESSDSLAPFTTLRRFNTSIASSSRPSLMVFTARREMENAAGASNAYNEPDEQTGNNLNMSLVFRPRTEGASENNPGAVIPYNEPTSASQNNAGAVNTYNEPVRPEGNIMSLTLRPRPAQQNTEQALQNTAQGTQNIFQGLQSTVQVGYRAKQAAANRDFVRLQERAENGTNRDRELMARLTARLKESVDTSRYTPQDFIRAVVNTGPEEAFRYRAILNHNGFGDGTEPCQVDLSHYNGDSDPSWFQIGEHSSARDNMEAGFNPFSTCDEYDDVYDTGDNFYQSTTCNRTNAKQCQTVRDHPSSFCTCKQCHAIQNREFLSVQRDLAEDTKLYLCPECAAKIQSMPDDKANTCECISVVSQLWLCHNHRKHGYQCIGNAITQVDEFMIRAGTKIQSRTLCPACHKNEGDISTASGHASLAGLGFRTSSFGEEQGRIGACR